MFRCTSPITFQSHLGAIQAVLIGLPGYI